MLQSQEQDAGRKALQEDRAREGASEGIIEPAGPLPHLDAIQQSFGSHGVSGVEAHTGERATAANQELGAVGYTTDNHAAFAGTPDLHTAAHEAAHVVRRRTGVHLREGVGEVGDNYERQADAVAERVVRGASAGNLLSRSAGTTPPLVQRQIAPTAETPGATPATDAVLPSADELTTRIARCIGIWETNRGKDNPAPKESSLDTVAGVHASMATIEQATIPYAITALKGHKELRDKATPPLTMKELNDAEARAAAVVTLLTSVDSASAKGEKPDDFIKNNAAAILATGLSNDDVKNMFSAVTLKGTLDTARAGAEAEGKTAKEEAVKEKKTDKEQATAEKAAAENAVKKSIDAIPTTDRLGLGEGSLKAYTNKPGNWGENRAGWQRKAVASMPGNIGSRIEAVAVSDNGTALALPVIKTRVNAELAKKPVPSLEEIVKVVAQKNNPGEKNYGKHVWETYDRLYD